MLAPVAFLRVSSTSGWNVIPVLHLPLSTAGLDGPVASEAVAAVAVLDLGSLGYTCCTQVVLLPLAADFCSGVSSSRSS